MDRMLIYILAIINISVGLILFYRKPSPFRNKPFRKIKKQYRDITR